MYIVINGINTVEELKDLKAYLEQKAKELYENHKKAFSIWKEGEIEKVWLDTNGNICIEYKSGNWWHYRETDNGLEWW